jgi:hypothetical protein
MATSLGYAPEEIFLLSVGAGKKFVEEEKIRDSVFILKKSLKSLKFQSGISVANIPFKGEMKGSAPCLSDLYWPSSYGPVVDPTNAHKDLCHAFYTQPQNYVRIQLDLAKPIAFDAPVAELEELCLSTIGKLQPTIKNIAARLSRFWGDDRRTSF